jgi:methyl-accepting chemotaxis protein
MVKNAEKSGNIVSNQLHHINLGGKQMKFLRRTKLVQAIIGIVVIAVVSMGANELLGILNMKKINNNMENMYDNKLVPISRLAGIRGSFLTIRLEANKAKLNYSSNYDEEIKKQLGNINDYIKDYEATKMDDLEVEKLKEFKTYIKEYMIIWDRVKGNLEKGQSSASEDEKKFAEIGDKADADLVLLRNYNEKTANELKIQSDVIYKNSIYTLIGMFTVVTLLYIVISTLVVRIVRKSSKEVIEALGLVSSGDLTLDIKYDGDNEFAQMKKALSITINNMKTMIKQIKESSTQVENRAESLSAVSEEMSSATNNVTSAIQDVAKGTATQSEDLVSIAAVLSEFGEKIDKITRATNEADSKANKIDEFAKGSSIKMNDLVQSVNVVGTSSKDFAGKVKKLGSNISKISEIINLINDISDQTNLLALNASIESARAGEAGKGFAVVAEEIRKLAEQSRTSSDSIAQLLNGIITETQTMVKASDNIVNEVDGQVNILNLTNKAFDNIIQAVADILPTIGTVTTSTLEIKSDKDVILEKVETTSSIAEEVSASSEEISASMEEMNASSEEVAGTAFELSDMTKEMISSVNQFKI